MKVLGELIDLYFAAVILDDLCTYANSWPVRFALFKRVGLSEGSRNGRLVAQIRSREALETHTDSRTGLH